MRKDSGKHELEVLSSAPGCAVFRCDCGIYHVQLKTMTMKMSESEFRRFRDCVLLAGSTDYPN